jgi:transcriptional regulator GlxA family with amidase domain
MAANTFRQMFPDVNLVTEKIITDEQGIYSSGGAFSYLNLILYLIEKYAGRDMAILSAKVFAIEMERENQLSFTIFQGQKGHEDEPIKKHRSILRIISGMYGVYPPSSMSSEPEKPGAQV